MVVVPTVLVSLAAVTLAFLLPARYRAAALVRAEWEVADEAMLRQRGLDLAERRSQAVRQRFAERPLQERALAETTPYAGGVASATLARQVERLRSDLRVRSMGASSFAVEFEHSDPAKASLVPNAVVRILIEETDEARRVARAAADPTRGPSMRFELLVPAALPAAPESPNPFWFGLAGALLGLVLGLSAAVVAEHRDRSVKGPEDLDDILPVPLLTTVPELREREKSR